MYIKEDAEKYMAAYDRVLNALKKLDTSYNLMMEMMHAPVIKGSFKVTGDTRLMPIVEQKYDEIQWSCSTLISTESKEP